MNLEQINNLYTAFKSLPPEIKDWFMGEQANTETRTIAQQFVLSDNQELKLPFLILRLVTQNLPPEQFKSALAETLAIDHALAEKITDALTEKILAPIKQPLQFAGVNIDLLKFNTPVDTDSANREAHRTAETPHPPPQSPQSASRAQNPAPPIQSKPFVLHEEPSFSRGADNNILETKPSFIFNPADAQDAPRASAPAKVIIERVVHYNQLRTPLNQTSAPKSNHNKKIETPKTKWFV